MDRNLLLAVGFSFLVITVWAGLQPSPQERPPGGLATEPTEAPEPVVPPSDAVPPSAELPPLPSTPSAEVRPSEVRPVADETIAIERAGYRAELTTRGGGLLRWTLTDYHSGGRDPEPIVLTTGESPFDVAAATPFAELGFGDLSNVAWGIESQDAYGVVFALEREGVRLRKRWSFEDAFSFRLKLEVENRSARDVAPSFAVSWPAHEQNGNDFREQSVAVLHEGSLEQELLAGIGQPGFLGLSAAQNVIDFSASEGSNDWAGMNTTYFLAALLPDDPAKASSRFVATDPGVAGVAQLFFEPVRIPQGLGLSREFRGFAGPKRPEILSEVGGDSLLRSIDLGWSWVAPLTRFFAWLLHAIYQFVPNYGFAIILLTIGVRVVTTPLTLRQMRSMERMRAVQPKLKEIQEKYADDRQKQSEEMMRLYRQEKVNPLGGCLPMILQLPVFIGLFYALRSSIDLRQAPFIGWINDLSAPEMLFEIPGIGLPVRVLPLVMGASMVVQQRLTPMQMDPAQARMMMTVMPVMMTVVFYQFASGLVLYWMVSNVLAIAHQLWVGRRMRTGAAPA